MTPVNRNQDEIALNRRTEKRKFHNLESASRGISRTIRDFAWSQTVIRHFRKNWHRMKFYLTLLFVFSFIFCFSQREIGELKDGRFIFTVDTVKLKNYFSENLFRKDGGKAFQKIEIQQRKILFSNTEYFCLTLSNFKRNLTVSKWLTLKDHKLYLVNDVENDDIFETMIQTCKGNDNCIPNVFELDGKKNWTCGENIKCLSPEEAKKHPCISSKTIVDENF